MDGQSFKCKHCNHIPKKPFTNSRNGYIYCENHCNNQCKYNDKIHQLINQLKIKCPNQFQLKTNQTVETCQWTDKLYKLQYHLSHCPFEIESKINARKKRFSNDSSHTKTSNPTNSNNSNNLNNNKIIGTNRNIEKNSYRLTQKTSTK